MESAESVENVETFADNDNEKPAEVQQLMTNIFGEDSDDEEEQHHEEGDGEQRPPGYEDEAE
uniref:Uncharacterized protein n=1 Tax=Panagrolaimus sp. PS1159 TaxID=55785 RepID=A0AC35G9U7_9BILA